MRTLPAAAIPVGTIVHVFDPRIGEKTDMTIVKVENSTPIPGQITWYFDTLAHVVVRAGVRVQIVSLP